MRTDIETLYGIKVDPSMTIWPWLVRHAAWLIERFLVRANGATSYEDCYGVSYRGTLIKFGETAIFRHQMSPGGKAAGGRVIKKADNRFEKGIFVGKRYDNNEMLFATKTGVYGSRTVKALPASQKSDLSMLKDMLGVPWEMQNQVRPGRRPNAAPPQALPVPKERENQ